MPIHYAKQPGIPYCGHAVVETEVEPSRRSRTAGFVSC